jgi:hypothetical protein
MVCCSSEISIPKNTLIRIRATFVGPEKSSRGGGRVCILDCVPSFQMPVGQSYLLSEVAAMLGIFEGTGLKTAGCW